jgi:hypothetical protein
MIWRPYRYGLVNSHPIWAGPVLKSSTAEPVRQMKDLGIVNAFIIL